MGDFQEIYDEYKDTDLKIMMINATDGQNETIESALKYIQEGGYTLPYYFDQAMSEKDGTKISDSALVNYQVPAYPATVFIDREGNVFKSQMGLMHKDDIKKVLDELLK